MKLHHHPLSTSSRTLALLIHDFGIDVEEITVSLHLEENFQPAFLALNPIAAVPVLDDDGVILTEGIAILKYLAPTRHLPIYPDNALGQFPVN